MKKNVLVLGHSLIVDTNRHLWAHLALDYGYDVTLVCPKHWRSNLIERLSCELHPQMDQPLHVHALPVYFSGNASFFFFSPWRLWRILRQKQFTSIVLCQETWAISLTFLSLLMLLSANRKSSLHLWVCQNIKKQKLFWLRFFERVNTALVDAILCPNTECASVIRWKKIQAPCWYFPFSFDPWIFQQLPPMKASSLIRIGHIGRLTAEKGIEDLIQALESLSGEGVKPLPVFAGAGPLQEKVQSLNPVHFLGVLPHRQAHLFYADIEILVLASRTTNFWKEQFGRVLVEAAMAGRLVVGSNSGAIPEVMQRLGMPFIFQHSDPLSLKEVLKKALETISSGKFAELVEQSRSRAIEQFSHQQVAARYHGYLQTRFAPEDRL